MSIIFNLFKIVIVLGIGIHVLFLDSLIQLGNKINKVDETTNEKKQYCNIYNDNFNDYYLLCYALIIMCTLLIYICFVVFTFKYDQIDWEEYDVRDRIPMGGCGDDVAEITDIFQSNYTDYGWDFC